MSYAQRVLKRKALESVPRITVSYMDTSFVPPTSNVVERLFSKAKLVLHDRRQKMSRANFEICLRLAVNDKYWDLQTVATAMTSTVCIPIDDEVEEL